MCGIVYSKSLVGKPVNKTILNRYIFQRSRGTDGFGFYTPETNRLTHNTREGRILSLLRRNKKATEILFHHRMPTSTMNVRNACHPFSTKDVFEHNYIVVHNGVLWNEDELRTEHEKMGIDYISEQEDGSYNDSEALAYDLARYVEGQVDHISSEGSIAFIMIQRNKKGTPTAMFFGRNTGNPLMLDVTDEDITLSSEGAGELIEPNQMYCFNYKTGVITRSPCRFPNLSGYGGNYGYGGGYYDDDYLENYGRGYSTDGFGNRVSPTAEETKRYFQNESEAGQEYAQSEVKRLLDENYEDPTAAIDAGASEIAELEKVEDSLRASVELTDTASEDDTDKFYRIGDRIHYLTLAVQALEGGLSGQSQMGFRFTPDHEPYQNKNHIRVYRNPAKEATDPLTGYVYYPYAE